METCMKKVQLPLSEKFTIHAVALINKVHHGKTRAIRDSQMETIMMARSQNFSYQQADEGALARYGSL